MHERPAESRRRRSERRREVFELRVDHPCCYTFSTRPSRPHSPISLQQGAGAATTLTESRTA